MHIILTAITKSYYNHHSLHRYFRENASAPTSSIISALVHTSEISTPTATNKNSQVDKVKLSVPMVRNDISTSTAAQLTNISSISENLAPITTTLEKESRKRS